jgi:hypothetical protein
MSLVQLNTVPNSHMTDAGHAFAELGAMQNFYIALANDTPRQNRTCPALARGDQGGTILVFEGDVET